MPDDPDQPLVKGPSEPGSPTLPAWGSETREARLARLLARARELPESPGVYLMKDHKGVVVYVGKAGRLPSRVSSYFQPGADVAAGGPTKVALLEAVHDFDFLVCDGEWEALLTENRLIKDIGPRFNVRLTDDKTYPYLVITQREDFPRVYVTRNLSEPLVKGAKTFGPFASAGKLREAVTLLQRVFKFRTCSLDIVEGDQKNKHFRPCLLASIGQCTAPCADRIAKEPYRLDVDRFVRFIEGKRSVMLRQMREEMEQASAAQEFEKAAVLRDQLRAIEKLDERAKGGKKSGWQPETEVGHIDPKKALRSLQKTLAGVGGLDRPIRCVEAIDIAHLAGCETVGSKVCFVDGRPFKSEYRRYRIRGEGTGDRGQGKAGGINDDYASIREVVSRRYREAGEGHELYPDVIIIDGGLGQLHAALEAFGQVDVRPPMVISLAKKEELIYVQDRAEPIRLGRENLGLRFCQAIRDEAHRFAQHYHHVLRRKKTLEEE